MMVDAVKKPKDSLRWATPRQLEGSAWALEVCRKILGEYQPIQEEKGFKPYNPQDYEEEKVESPEDETPKEAFRDSTLADQGEKGAAEHWKNESLASTLKRLPDGDYCLSGWQISHSMRAGSST